MLKFDELSRKHDRSGFDCGVYELNQYLKNTARQHSAKGVSRTFVLLEDGKPDEILGFYTLVFCEIRVHELPVEYLKKYHIKAHAAKLARLAVSKKYQRQKLGKYMMVNAIERTMLIAKNIGIIGFFVDAKDISAKRYYEQFGFISLPENSLQLFMPLQKLQQIYEMILGM